MRMGRRRKRLHPNPTSTSSRGAKCAPARPCMPDHSGSFTQWHCKEPSSRSSPRPAAAQAQTQCWARQTACSCVRRRDSTGIGTQERESVLKTPPPKELCGGHCGHSHSHACAPSSRRRRDGLRTTDGATAGDQAKSLRRRSRRLRASSASLASSAMHRSSTPSTELCVYPFVRTHFNLLLAKTTTKLSKKLER